MEFDRQRVFQKIIAPVPLSVFLKNHWEKRPLHIAGTPQKFQEFFSRQSFEAALQNRPQIDKLLLRASFIDSEGRYTDVHVSSDQILPFFEAGLTVSVASIHKVDERLNALRKQIKQEFVTGRDVGFNCFFSPPGKGFGMHLDDHSVLLLQIEGDKKWKFSSRPALSGAPHNIILPPKGEMDRSFSEARIQRPKESQFSEVRLRAGDALYLPSGTWHRGIAGENSLGLSLAFSPFAPRHIVDDFLISFFEDTPVWLQILPAIEMGVLQRGYIPKNLEKILSKRLIEFKQLIRRLTVADLCSVWHMRATSPDSAVLSQQRKRRIRAQDNLVVVRSEPATLFLRRHRNGQRTVSLFFGGMEIEYSESAYDFLTTLLKQDRFNAASTKDWGHKRQTWRSTQSILQDLYEIGLLRIP